MHLISLHRNTRTFLPSNAPEASAEGSRCGLGRGVCARAPFARVRVARPPKSSGNPKDSGQSWCRTKALQPLLETWRLAGHPELCSPKGQPLKSQDAGGWCRLCPRPSSIPSCGPSLRPYQRRPWQNSTQWVSYEFSVHGGPNRQTDKPMHSDLQETRPRHGEDRKARVEY